MNRRQFLGGIAGSFLLPTTTLAQENDATPAATPQHSGRPRPFVLGDGIELVDYRIYPSSDVRRVIGEIWNTRNDMVDAPVVSMTFPDVGFAYAVPFMPILRPGESTMIFGVLPDQVDTQDRLESGDFGLCEPAEPGRWTKEYLDLNLTVSRIESRVSDSSVNVLGEIRNDGNTRAAFTCVRGLVRDHNGRYAGCSTDNKTGHLLPGNSKQFSLWAGINIPLLANPYALLRPGSHYTVDVIPGLVGPLTTPGCATAFTGG